MSEQETLPLADQIFDRAKQVLRESTNLSAEGALFRALDELGLKKPAERAEFVGILLGKMREARKEIKLDVRQDRGWSVRLAEKAAENPTHAARTHEE